MNAKGLGSFNLRFPVAAHFLKRIRTQRLKRSSAVLRAVLRSLRASLRMMFICRSAPRSSIEILIVDKPYKQSRLLLTPYSVPTSEYHLLNDVLPSLRLVASKESAYRKRFGVTCAHVAPSSCEYERMCNWTNVTLTR